ncbi:MAG: AAA family ATPase, partial [Acidobacteria bacterium]|nr:AAA family ATPase [Acidobacteriota bacterium]
PPDARFWSIAVESKRWAAYRDGGFVAAAWPNVGDISAMTREELDRALDTVAEGNPGDYSAPGASQMWAFASIKPGDRVVASGGADLALGIGTVVGPYSFDASSPHAHRLAVRWDDVQARRHASDTKWKQLVVEMSPEEFDGIAGTPPVGDVFKADDPVDVETAASGALEVVAIDENIEPVVPPEPNELILIEDVAAATNFDVELLERWVRAIHRKGQAVLYGPPGTGKTFVAEWLARHLAGGGFGTIETVQFHPAYSYEEFMAGIRPRTRADGSLEYALEDGFFVRFCDRARTLDGTSVLIIDELNRANLPRVFGELMYLLEYRDNDVAIAGSRRFSIPDNVRIIGTMNTADRSIALVDHALRRRFAFLGLLPNYGVLRNRHANTSGIDIEGLIGVLAKLNAAIDDPHYEVGISFFCGPDLAASIGDIWQMEIEPYVEEYFFDRRSVFAEFRWTKVRDSILAPGGSAP